VSASDYSFAWPWWFESFARAFGYEPETMVWRLTSEEGRHWLKTVRRWLKVREREWERTDQVQAFSFWLSDYVDIKVEKAKREVTAELRAFGTKAEGAVRFPLTVGKDGVARFTAKEKLLNCVVYVTLGSMLIETCSVDSVRGEWKGHDNLDKGERIKIDLHYAWRRALGMGGLVK
jgi:hypothetical protein